MAKGGAKELCSVDGCHRVRVGWGFCGLHYARYIRSGQTKPSHRSQAMAETMAADGTRKCFKCGQRKPFDAENFPKDTRNGRLKGTCTACLRLAVKRATIRKRYALEHDDFLAMLATQSNKCAVCAVQFESFQAAGAAKQLRPHIDHDHQSGRVRGLLCHHCNVLIGHAGERAEILSAAIRYLERA